ncbi:IQ and ubiquitin-like domain-containing protein [Aricia agestis]|uniref:IQ and ubiquitin-like domain-containing protein n=1 Tax=Aricia agestis TaxID=91739 RepID=UPI001C202CC9|nr:IQ and ubiquitin-like domain-containing protein [Aricia agestis]
MDVVDTIRTSSQSVKGTASCQCELGREKLLTAPPYKQVSIPDNESVNSRLQTAPCARDLQQNRCPISHIIITFKSPLKPNETYTKVFPATTPIKQVKRKLSKLIAVSNNNILLTKNRHVLKEATLLSDLKSDAYGNVVIDVFTKNSEEFSLSAIPKDSYVHDIFYAMVPKKFLPFIAIKFKVKCQNGVFTRSYHSNMTIQEIKKNLGGIFQTRPDNLVILRGGDTLENDVALCNLDYDRYGIVDVELFTTDNTYLNLNNLYKEVPLNDIIQVVVPLDNAIKNVNVEVYSETIKKPFLGGYRNIHTGVIYHHAFSQTPQRPDRVQPENKNCRDTQTAETRDKYYDTSYSRAIQMDCVHAYIPNVTDRILVPRPYEPYDEKMAHLNLKHYATVIQRAFRRHRFRQKVKEWLEECLDRLRRIREEERLEQEANERRLRKDLITKTFPRNREDFDQLYAMVDRWKHAEITRISQLHSKGPKIAEFSLLLDKEVELLRCIESYRIKVKEDSRKIKEKQFLEEISKPIAWYGRDGKVITMETIEIQKAREFKEFYNSYLRCDMRVNERIELLVEMKFSLQEFNHDLTEEIIELLERECDLLIRGCNDHQLEFLRRRTAACIFQLIKTSELNSGVTKCKDIRDYRKMENSKLYFCEMCHQVKSYTDFPLNTRMSGYLVCTSCSWRDVAEKSWIDMTPYKFILRATQRDERKRKCWGSLAFVLQEKDIFYIVDKIWHSRSAISECDDMTQLRLCRWRVKEDWSPWNCFLITTQEMKAHVKLVNPELVYDDELIRKVVNKHKLAKGTFEQLISVNRRFTESGDWHNVRAAATDRVDAVEPC